MADNLNQIKIDDFTKLAATRQKVVDMSPAKHLPDEGAYPANALAKLLHPDHQYFVISKVRDLGEGVKCFTFVPNPESKTSHVAYFAAGQYLSVNLNIDGMPVTRAYSISSSPKMASAGEIELTIKQVPDGLVSNWVHKNWTVGTKVDTSGPLGTFTYEGLRDAKTVVGIAGGSGITPFLSLARAIADGDEDFRLILLYGSRTADSIVYKTEFDALEAQTDKIKVVHVLSHEEKEGFEHGFVTADLIQKYAPDESYSIFLCGPQAMYNFVDQELEKLHLRRKFIRHEAMVEIYNALEWSPTGRVAVKLSTGEPPASNYLHPELIADLVQLVDGTIVECNTAYGGSRAETAMHYQVAEDHGFTDIAPVQIQDENGSITLPVEGGTVLSENYVGAAFADYDSYLVLSHFKGHGMAGFGGAIKNISIGLGSSEGKCWIHTAGKSRSSFMGGDQDAFLESMGDAGKSVSDYLGNGERIVYINVMNRLSIDCDCSGNPAEPDMHDIGILASADPVALDQACIDLIWDSEGNESFVSRVESRNGLHTLENAEVIGLGSRTYRLIDLNG